MARLGVQSRPGFRDLGSRAQTMLAEPREGGQVLLSVAKRMRQVGRPPPGAQATALVPRVHPSEGSLSKEMAAFATVPGAGWGRDRKPPPGQRVGGGGGVGRSGRPVSLACGHQHLLVEAESGLRSCPWPYRLPPASRPALPPSVRASSREVAWPWPRS